MAKDKDVSSTEKLLNVIRKGPDRQAPDIPGQKAAGSQEKKPASVFGKGIIPFGTADVVGVEIRNERLNLVKMIQTGGQWKAVQASSVSMREGMSLDSPDFPEFLRIQLSEVDGIKKSRIWTMVPDFKGEIWQVNVPQVKEDFSNVVFWSAKRERDFDENETVFDYRVLGEIIESGARKIAVEVYTAPRKEIDLVTKAFSAAGFPLEGITLSSFALQNIFTNRLVDPGSEAFAVLYIDHDCTYIDLHQEKRMLLSRVIKTGLDSMAESIMEEQSLEGPKDIVFDDQGLSPEGAVSEHKSPPLTIETAMQLIALLEGGLPRSAQQSWMADYPPEKIFSMITPALERLARQVERTIDHSINVLKNPPPARIYICGRLAAVPALAAFMREHLGLETEILDPLDPSRPGVSPMITSMEKTVRASLVPAAGLATSSNNYTPNFLYTAMDREKQKILKRNASLAAIAMMVVFLITAGFWFQARQDLKAHQQEVQTLERQLAGHSPRVTTEMISSMGARFNENSQVLRDYSQKLVPLAALSEITAITPDNVKLLRVRMDVRQAGAGSAGRQPGIMVLDGFIRGEENLFETYLSSFILRIRNSPLFLDTVIHRSSAEEFGPEGQVLRFVINVNLKQV